MTLLYPRRSPLANPIAILLPNLHFFGVGRYGRQSARARRHKHPRAVPLSPYSLSHYSPSLTLLLPTIPLHPLPHVMPPILPPIPKLRLPHLPLVPPLPDALPDALAHDAHRLRPEARHLRFQPGRARGHFAPGQLADVARRAGDDVRVAETVAARQMDILDGPAQPRARQPRRVQQPPEVVGRVCVRVPGRRGRDARVEADEDADQAGLEDVG